MKRGLKHTFISSILCSLIVLSTITTIATVNAQQQANLVVNGQFTDWTGQGDYWVPSYWFVHSGEVDPSDDVHSPPYSVRFNTYPGGGISQSGSTTSGLHILRFWYKSSDWYGMDASITWWERKGKMINSWRNHYAGPNEWTEITVSFDAPIGTTMFTLSFEAKDNVVLLDDVELLGPPTPPTLLPDLAFEKVGFDKPEPFDAGDTIRFGAIIVNQGDGDAYNFRVEVYLDGRLFESGTFSLSAHQSTDLWCNNLWMATESAHTLTWVADSTNAVAESNENNNQMSRTFTIGPPPPPPFDFSISVDPSSQTIKQGETATYRVTIISLSKTVQTVSLSLSGHYSTMSYSFNPSSSNPTFTSTLTITTSTSTPAGTYTLTITGKDGGKTHSISVRLAVEEVVIKISYTLPSGESVAKPWIQEYYKFYPLEQESDFWEYVDNVMDAPEKYSKYIFGYLNNWVEIKNEGDIAIIIRSIILHIQCKSMHKHIPGGESVYDQNWDYEYTYELAFHTTILPSETKRISIESVPLLFADPYPHLGPKAQVTYSQKYLIRFEILYDSNGGPMPPKLTEQFVVFAHDIRSEVFFRIIDWVYSLAMDAIKAGKWTVDLSIKYLEKALKIIWWLIDVLRNGTSLTLQETGHRLYLHVYDSQGRHVGLNYESNQIELGIVGANYFELEGFTLIALPSEITNFRYVIDAKEAESSIETYTIAISALKDGSAVSEEMWTENIKQGEKQEHSIEVSSDGKSIWIDRPWLDRYKLWHWDTFNRKAQQIFREIIIWIKKILELIKEFLNRIIHR